tara:strand:+ start:176 stop:958 length:783 start_codon:yes stop_codon:yes gene_type:complete
MQKTYIITGSSSGLGASIVKSLRDKGSNVIGIDRKQDAEIIADLSNEKGVSEALDHAFSMCPNPAGVVSNAGVSPLHNNPYEILEVNWFSAHHVLDASLNYLAETSGSSAVAISSIGAAVGGDEQLIASLLSGNRENAYTLLKSLLDNDPTIAGIVAYSSCKSALAIHVRRNAQVWGSCGVRCNVVAPGKMDTAMLDGLLADPILSPGVSNLPSGITSTAQPQQIADVVEFLLGPSSSFIHGQVIYVDGGTEAILRPDLV